MPSVQQTFANQKKMNSSQAHAYKFDLNKNGVPKMQDFFQQLKNAKFEPLKKSSVS
jgi:hypothetical protein